MKEFTAEARRIRALCKEKKWSMQRLAAESGVRYNTLTNYMYRGDYVKSEVAEKLAKALGTTAAYIKTGARPGADLTADMRAITDILAAMTPAHRARAIAEIYSVVRG